MPPVTERGANINLKRNEMSNKKIVRTYSAGVFFGVVESLARLPDSELSTLLAAIQGLNQKAVG